MLKVFALRQVISLFIIRNLAMITEVGFEFQDPSANPILCRIKNDYIVYIVPYSLDDMASS